MVADEDSLDGGGGEGWLDQLREETEINEDGPPGFVLEDLLGRGGMAEVYLAHRTGPMGFSRKVVVKCIRPDILGESLSVERFIREASLAAQLHHPNIVEVIDLITQNDMYYIVMEFLHGMHLGKIAQKLNKMRVRCPPGVVAFVGKGVASALHYAHNFTGEDGKVHRLVHRDISPENIMVTYAGQAKLVDFGVAKDLDDINSLTQGDQVIGKPLYLPPESLDGSKATPSRDIYSLGMALWVALTGRPPFATDGGPEGLAKLMSAIIHDDIPTFQSVGVDVPDELETIVRRTLSKDPNDRPEADELREELDQFISQERVTSDTVAKMMNRLGEDKRPEGSSRNKNKAAKKQPVIRQETPPTGFMRSPKKEPASPETAVTLPGVEAEGVAASGGAAEEPTMIASAARTASAGESIPLPTQKILMAVGGFVLVAGLVALIIMLATGGDNETALEICRIDPSQCPGGQPPVAQRDPPPPPVQPENPPVAPDPPTVSPPQPSAGEGFVGTLEVKCGGWGWVAIDGERVGLCPSVRVRVPVGERRVAVERDSKTLEKYVNIVRGQTAFVDFRPPRRKGKARDVFVKPPLR